MAAVLATIGPAVAPAPCPEAPGPTPPGQGEQTGVGCPSSALLSAHDGQPCCTCAPKRTRGRRMPNLHAWNIGRALLAEGQPDRRVSVLADLQQAGPQHFGRDCTDQQDGGAPRQRTGLLS